MKTTFYDIIVTLLDKWTDIDEKKSMLKTLQDLDDKSINISGSSAVAFIGALLKYSNKKMLYDTLRPKVELVYGVRVNEVTVRNYLNMIKGGLDGVSKDKLQSSEQGERKDTQ